jgi:tetratricopeptide (TPR) repeat protein
VYLDNKDYLKGLTVWRNASTFSPGTQIAQDMKLAMERSFRDVFANDRLKDISPLEAISLYEEFKDLTPPGDEGNRVVEKLAERLVDADLLGRAAALLEYHVNNRLTGGKKAGIAIRLAAIRLLDGNPDGALRSLELAEDALDKVDAGTAAPAPAPADAAKAGEAKAEMPAAPGAAKADPEKRRQIDLLRARALSMKKKPDEALAILEDMRLDPDVNRLRTDIAWTSGKWEEAAMALNDLIVAEDISPRMPLTDYQRDIILNRAIALNLSGNRVALANLRERYNGQMKGTTKGKMFEIVTRPRRPDMIGSREAIASMISEIDLFSGFLDSYSKMQEEGKAGAAKEPAAVKEPVPVDGKGAADAEKAVTKPPEKAAE